MGFGFRVRILEGVGVFKNPLRKNWCKRKGKLNEPLQNSQRIGSQRDSSLGFSVSGLGFRV